MVQQLKMQTALQRSAVQLLAWTLGIHNHLLTPTLGRSNTFAGICANMHTHIDAYTHTEAQIYKHTYDLSIKKLKFESKLFSSELCC